MMNESPLFVRTYELVLWLLPQTQNFPRAYRFSMAERLQRLVLDFQDSLVGAGKSRGEERRHWLARADLQIAQLRVLVRLARDMHLLTISRYEHAARMLVEVGRLLGAWIKQNKPD
ncbi:MAG TPA: diversity-generating retroelement protein Avd [Anaerolineales bacterium]|nr:diversity-generating retroelement protein Avd [Anaerolineales bacterium]